MKRTTNYHADFEPGGNYHIYNRTNNKELMFRRVEDCQLFLGKFEKYLSPFMGVYCRNLLPNHFHYFVRINNEQEILEHLHKLKHPCHFEYEFLLQKIDFSELIEREFSRLFNSYAKLFAIEYERKGNFFHRSFKRKKIDSDTHFTECVIYVHANALKHKLVTDFTDYPWTSWHELISEKPTKLLREELVEWFGGMPRLIKAHNDLTQYYYKSDISIEDDDDFEET